MALKTNFPTINSWTTQSSLWGGVWVVIAISSICVIAHKSEGEDFRQLALFRFV